MIFCITKVLNYPIDRFMNEISASNDHYYRLWNWFEKNITIPLEYNQTRKVGKKGILIINIF